jgi:hypothetical protein
VLLHKLLSQRKCAVASSAVKARRLKKAYRKLIWCLSLNLLALDDGTTRLNSAPSLAQRRGRGVSMATLATGKPVLNIGKISDTRFKFSFATDEGTLFCEISIPMKAGDTVPDDLRQRVAVAKLKRLLEAMGETMNDLD